MELLPMVGLTTAFVRHRRLCLRTPKRNNQNESKIACKVWPGTAIGTSRRVITVSSTLSSIGREDLASRAGIWYSHAHAGPMLWRSNQPARCRRCLI